MSDLKAVSLRTADLIYMSTQALSIPIIRHAERTYSGWDQVENGIAELVVWKGSKS